MLGVKISEYGICWTEEARPYKYELVAPNVGSSAWNCGERPRSRGTTWACSMTQFYSHNLNYLNINLNINNIGIVGLKIICSRVLRREEKHVFD